MGLFDLLFGGGSKPESAPRKQFEPAAVVKAAVTNIQPEAAAAVSAELSPEIVAAIAASISCVMDTSVSGKMAVHHSDGVCAVKSDYNSSAWALTGRQKLIDARQFM
jgi:hypothetical protein